jgi:hypothetical protein
MADDSNDDTVIRRRRVSDPSSHDETDTILVPRHGESRSFAPVATVPSGSDGSGSERVLAVRIGATDVPLSAPVIVGRHPMPQRVESGHAPHLIQVRSPSGQVSASHVRIWAEGGAVVIEDLHSTNGTAVREPGRAPRRMPSGATIVVLTGTVVDIGDGNVIEILSPRLRIAPGTPGSGPELHGGVQTDPGLHH